MSGIKTNLRDFVKRIRCKHSRTFSFCPQEVWWERDGAAIGKMEHGAVVRCCMDCGKTIGINYAE